MIFRDFLISLLNNAMNNYQAEKATNRWLKQNGISAKQFATTDVLLLQAQRVAHNTLKNHAHLLKADQLDGLKAYLTARRNQSAKATITATQAYRILNIGSKARRQAFRQHRQFN